MKIQVLGPGCAKCFALMNHVRIAVAALNLYHFVMKGSLYRDNVVKYRKQQR